MSAEYRNVELRTEVKRLSEYFSPKEAALLLKVNPKLIYAEIAAGRLRAIRIGTKIIRIPLLELEAWERAQLDGVK